MKNILAILAVVVILIFVGAFAFLKNPTQTVIAPTITPTTTVSDNSDFCKPSELDANLTTEGAAGNIFGTLSIKNISDRNCEIIGNNFIAPMFTAKNITVKNQGLAGPETLTLSPSQTVYSQIHYPNGPQCSTEVSQTPISYSYNISESDSITFKDQNGNSKLSIGVCKLDSEITEVGVWSLSENPVNQ